MDIHSNFRTVVRIHFTDYVMDLPEKPQYIEIEGRIQFIHLINRDNYRIVTFDQNKYTKTATFAF